MLLKVKALLFAIIWIRNCKRAAIVLRFSEAFANSIAYIKAMGDITLLDIVRAFFDKPMIDYSRFLFDVEESVPDPRPHRINRYASHVWYRRVRPMAIPETEETPLNPVGYFRNPYVHPDFDFQERSDRHSLNWRKHDGRFKGVHNCGRGKPVYKTAKKERIGRGQLASILLGDVDFDREMSIAKGFEE